MSVIRFFPRNLSNKWLVAEVNPTGLTEWVDYLPVQAVVEVGEKAYLYENDGHIPVDTLASTAGMTEWVDYIPVVTVEGRTERWSSTAGEGFIPVAETA